ncbi:LacI family DNA-binding transcriptional regulator [Yoonia sediminilitoris]|uniref:LacI family transcriptional regulator n=1 Tax=Yoonia sediminilitoris TaxID=1286148 RepID=A0A2T6KH97_9RHOB|nr:LacI family DNA-binding transcriptional regulator [Yoonia sediminilitoris]PUB14877.1 LacI family transcriptional regulator [Yoonia sediminilitoris]RCW95594.1 LacI family transcriptional regulator [Yoonia sediminilitoris]
MAKNVQRKATSFDVARLAGVSRSAVSRAFTPGANIAPETKEKVTKAALELGYRVNSLARGLQKDHSGLVGLVASRLDTPLRSRQVRQLSEALIREGLKPMLITAESPDEVGSLIESLLGYSVAGMIFTSDTPPRALIEDCGRLGLPVVLVNRAGASNWGDRVVADNAQAGQLAARILVDSGAKCLGCLVPRKKTYSVSGRAEAFLGAAAERGLSTEILYTQDQGYADARLGINETDRAVFDRIDGLFCSTDLMALGALDALRIDLGIAVPDQIQVLGFDDIEQASWGSFNLSTIRQDVDAQTKTVVRLLRERIADSSLTNRVERQPLNAVLRGTTRHDG